MIFLSPEVACGDLSEVFIIMMGMDRVDKSYSHL